MQLVGNTYTRKTQLSALVLVSALVLAIGLSACSGPLSGPQFGAVFVALGTAENARTGAEAPLAVARYELIVSADDFDTVTVRADAGETALRVSVPAGAGRQLTLTALSESEAPLYEGSTTIDVEAGVEQSVSLDMRKLFSDELRDLRIVLADNSSLLAGVPVEFDSVTILGTEIVAVPDSFDPTVLTLSIPWFADPTSVVLQFDLGDGASIARAPGMDADGMDADGTEVVSGLTTVDLSTGVDLHVTTPDGNTTVYTVTPALSVDASELVSEIQAAVLLHDGSLEGTGTGEYASGSQATFLTAIDAARAFFGVDFMSATQSDLDAARANLAAARAAFLAARNVAVVVSTPAVTMTEGGTLGSFAVRLAEPPTADVEVDATASGGIVSVSPSHLTFTSSNWDQDQMFELSVPDDSVASGPRSETVTHAVTSADPAYGGATAPSVSVTVLDNELLFGYHANVPSGDVNAELFGAIPPGSGVYPKDSGITVADTSATGPFVQGYRFAGWNTAADGSGATYAPGSSLMLTADTTLYAQWDGGPGNFAAAFSGGDGTATTPYQIASPAELWNMGHRDLIDQLTHYQLIADIDLGVAPWNENGGWPGVGNIGITEFNSTVDGSGYVISNLTMDRAGGNLGLFTRVDGATIQNLILQNVFIQSDEGFVGAIIGHSDSSNDTLVVDSSAAGSIVVNDLLYGDAADAEDRNVGGLVGYGLRTSIIRSYADVTVSNTGHTTGGLIAYAATYTAGGADTIEDSYALGNVTGGDKTGGLVGQSDAPIYRSFATGTVNGALSTGGLVGANNDVIENSYAVGGVTGTDRVGGLAGEGNGAISTSYAAGPVSATAVVDGVGGILGYATAPNVTSSFYDELATGQSDTGRGTALPQASMTTEASFKPGVNDWDFTLIWAIQEGSSYPYHQWWTGTKPAP